MIAMVSKVRYVKKNVIHIYMLQKRTSSLKGKEQNLLVSKDRQMNSTRRQWESTEVKWAVAGNFDILGGKTAQGTNVKIDQADMQRNIIRRHQ